MFTAIFIIAALPFLIPYAALCFGTSAFLFLHIVFEMCRAVFG